MTVGLSDGQSLWAVRYATKGDAPTLYLNKDLEDIKKVLHDRVMAQYRQKEAEFPVTVAMANFMSERPTQPGAQK